jgi:hypothetical protein
MKGSNKTWFDKVDALINAMPEVIRTPNPENEADLP